MALAHGSHGVLSCSAGCLESSRSPGRRARAEFLLALSRPARLAALRQRAPAVNGLANCEAKANRGAGPLGPGCDPHRCRAKGCRRWSPMGTARGRGHAATTAATATSVSAAHGGSSIEVRLFCVCMCGMHVDVHRTAYWTTLPHSNCRHTALASCIHRPWPVCTHLPRPDRRIGCCCTAAVRSCVCRKLCTL